MAGTNTPDNEPDEQGRETVESDATTPLAVERRLEKNLIISILLFIILAVLFGSLRLVIGVVVGGILAYLNYRWLHTSLKAVLVTAATGQPPPNTGWRIVQFLLRWLIILVVLGLAVWQFGNELAIGIIVGLFALGNAAMMEAVIQAYYQLRDK
ncbi:MAG: hypothetical protein AB1489_24865 [Acidobacteriota bacterium]